MGNSGSKPTNKTGKKVVAQVRKGTVGSKQPHNKTGKKVVAQVRREDVCIRRATLSRPAMILGRVYFREYFGVDEDLRGT